MAYESWSPFCEFLVVEFWSYTAHKAHSEVHGARLEQDYIGSKTVYHSVSLFTNFDNFLSWHLSYLSDSQISQKGALS